MTLGSGVQRQVDAFRAGFTQVFPYSALSAFTPDELVMLFGRIEEDWSLESKYIQCLTDWLRTNIHIALMDSIKADHGFNMDSKSVKNLLQTMSELSLAERRDFLQFTTGSPKLPIGGKLSCNALFERMLIILKDLRVLLQCLLWSASPVNPLILLMTTCQVSWPVSTILSCQTTLIWMLWDDAWTLLSKKVKVPSTCLRSIYCTRWEEARLSTRLVFLPNSHFTVCQGAVFCAGFVFMTCSGVDFQFPFRSCYSGRPVNYIAWTVVRAFQGRGCRGIWLYHCFGLT